MNSAVTLGILYLIIGGLLLFFGWRFIKLIAGLYGFLVGIWVGNIFADIFNASGAWELILVLFTAFALAVIAIALYTFVIAVMVGVLLFTLVYGIVNGLGAAAILSLIIAGLSGVLGFILIRHYKLVDAALIILTALQGAGAVASGAAILLDHSRADSLIHGNIAIITGTASAPWIIGWLALAMLGLVVQYRGRYGRTPAA
ncbi:MAG: hypothetical protein WBP26_01405 [Candidatus Saccharimonadales bacterium]